MAHPPSHIWPTCAHMMARLRGHNMRQKRCVVGGAPTVINEVEVECGEVFVYQVSKYEQWRESGDESCAYGMTIKEETVRRYMAKRNR